MRATCLCVRATRSELGRVVYVHEGPVGIVLREKRLERLGFTLDRTQHVERDDIAGALPDRGQRLLAVDAREARLLDVAVPPEAFERLRGVPGTTLADPVLRDRGCDSA